MSILVSVKLIFNGGLVNFGYRFLVDLMRDRLGSKIVSKSLFGLSFSNCFTCGFCTCFGHGLFGEATELASSFWFGFFAFLAWEDYVGDGMFVTDSVFATGDVGLE